MSKYQKSRTRMRFCGAVISLALVAVACGSDDDESGGGDGGGGDGAGAPTGGQDTDAGELPFTGADVVGLALAGLLMLAGGLLLRRREDAHAAH